ncbi:DNA-3-methyladenine glycosylase I [Leucobacter aridicollis]|uniref:DNA-3-methyladenine glycosylase I n=1 Tax=Leucobacter aridicollis TaxID=283878 RepID=UPI002106D55D|nr:DNA-3-methyladenine glycosylase I [Leucobacter aridicollis]UTX52036.1 DNA-3-methyladenine glycosylase I [Leucobacter aridicollis]
MTDTEAAPSRAAWALQAPVLTEYYDTEWGMPVRDERGVFERLTLEAFQSGLSWLTILRKRENFRAAFQGFDLATIAEYSDADIERLLADEGIIRNRAKIEATISNAKAVLALNAAGESLSELVWSHTPALSPVPETDAEVPTTSPESEALAKALKKRGFRFVGPTTMYALMSAIGVVDVHLVSSHRRGCSGLWNIDGTPVKSSASV